MHLDLLIIGPDRPNIDEIRSNVEGLSDVFEDQGYTVERGSKLPAKIHPENILFLINPFTQLPFDEFKKITCKNLYFYFADSNEYQDIYKELGYVANAVIVDDPLAENFFNQFCIQSRYIFHGLPNNWVKDGRLVNAKRDIDLSFYGRLDRGSRELFFSRIDENDREALKFKFSTNGGESLSDMYATYQRSKFVLNFTGISVKNPLGFGYDKSPKMTKQIKGRLYEALACGANVITEDHPNITYVFYDLMDYVHIVRDLNDLSLVEQVKSFKPISDTHFKSIYEKTGYENTINNCIDLISSNQTRKEYFSFSWCLEYRYRQAWMITKLRDLRYGRGGLPKIQLKDFLALLAFTPTIIFRGHG